MLVLNSVEINLDLNAKISFSPLTRYAAYELRNCRRMQIKGFVDRRFVGKTGFQLACILGHSEITDFLKKQSHEFKIDTELSNEEDEILGQNLVKKPKLKE